MRRLASALTLAVLTFVPSASVAQESAITDGVNWLIANQDASGLWGESNNTPFRDATVVVSILNIARGDSTTIAGGQSAIGAIETRSTDYLARRIGSIAAGGPENVTPDLVTDLVSRQNSDGGWGYQEHYRSNAHDTALALRALKDALYSDLIVLGNGVDYLVAQQNADHGWAFANGDTSRVFLTAHALLTLAKLQGDFDVSAAIQSGVAWLEGQVLGDGGFGTGSSSNPYETGLALAAMVKCDGSASEIPDATAYLEATQLPNGSWDDDAYATAIAVFGLIHIAPDPAVGSADIVLSNPTPSDDEIVTISVTVHNQGVVEATDVLVQIYDGNPSDGGVQIGVDQLVSTLSAGGQELVEVDWNTFGLGGDHEIYALVDPLDEIVEPDETNNVAIKPMHVYYPPDLVVSQVTFDPEYPDAQEPVTISITARNFGEMTATDISLQLWDGDPDAGGIPLLPPYVIPSLGPGGMFVLNVDMGSYFQDSGPHPMHSCIDPEDAIREISEYNNCLMEVLWIDYYCGTSDLAEELNLLGLPLEPVAPMTSHSLITQFASCPEIEGWDRLCQLWRTTLALGGGLVAGDDFDITLRDGFFARLTQAEVDSLFCGAPVTEHSSTDLESGYNIVSIPNEDACYTGYSLIGAIANCVEARSWDSSSQTWLIAEKIGEEEYSGDDFATDTEHGYFVRLVDSEVWTTAECDTFAMLPDLQITNSDVWLDPNPVVVGQPVGIYANTHNIGYETAYSPRLDIFAGDPNNGGTHLAGGNLPVDIPAGESSGYYGVEWTFNETGYYDIYCVSDYYDSIEELDENNNQGYQTLHVVAGRLQTGGTAGDPDTPAPATGLGDRTLVLRPDQALPMQTTPRPDESGHTVPATPGLPGGDIGQTALKPRYDGTTSAVKPSTMSRISVIENVVVGNQSSSSAAVTWTTDGAADGCINYGTDTGLGESQCQEGPDAEVHLVALESLQDETLYYFEVVSGGVVDDNGGAYYTFTTSSIGAGQPGVIHGLLITAAGDSTVAGASVGATLTHASSSSHPLITLTEENGIWLLNLGNFKDQASNDVLPYEAGDEIHLVVEAGSRGSGEFDIVLSGVSPQDCGVQQLSTVDVPWIGDPIPADYYLLANSPNPFDRQTTFRFGLPVPDLVELSIYNVAGRRVKVLVDKAYPAGNHSVIWDGLDRAGRPVLSGIYFYSMQSGSYGQRGKMFRLR